MTPLLLMLFFLPANAQKDTSATALRLSGYAEVYYSYDFNRPDNHTRPAFLYSHNRHHEFNLNLGYIKAAYGKGRMRANLALATGTYMNANYVAETGVLRNGYEANLGYKLSPRKDLWIDAGIFSSHLGFESAVSRDCWTLTRSLQAENSPYYESGVKVTYVADNRRWLLSALVLNGWQRIRRPDLNQTPALGTQIKFTPNANTTFNYSTFWGNDMPETNRRMRFFQNFYALFQFPGAMQVAAGFDIGIEQKEKGSTSVNTWFSPVLVARVRWNDHWSITGRGEYYADVDEVIIPTSTENGFQAFGYSLNIDCQLQDNACWRIEGRMIRSKDEIFTNAGGLTTSTDVAITTSVAISF